MYIRVAILASYLKLLLKCIIKLLLKFVFTSRKFKSKNVIFGMVIFRLE